MIRKNKITSSFLIGIFVLSGFALSILLVLWLGSSQFFHENKYYVTYFKGSVEGLEKGSPVKYLGVPVGSIIDINVAGGKLIEVVMQIETALEIDTTLRVKSELAGLAGGKFLQLSYPTNPDIINRFPKIDFDPPHELIRSSPSGIEEIEIAMREVMNNLRLIQTGEISNEAVRFLRTASDFFENKELYSIITKFDASAKKLDNILSKADNSNFIENIENTSSKLLRTSDELVAFALRLNTQIEELQLTSKMDNAFAQFDSTIYSTRKVVNVIGFRVEDILFTFHETLQELKATNKQLRRTLRAFNTNPSQLLFSNPPPEEK